MRKYFLILVLPILICACGEGQRGAYRMNLSSLSKLEVDDGLWTPYLLIHKDVTIPICTDWIESHFDSSMVVKAAEGIAYSLRFEKDPQLEVRRSGWITRLRSGSDYHLPQTDASTVSASVTRLFSDAENLRLTGDGKYADDMELTLFNEVLSGVSLKGDRFLGDLVISSDGDISRQAWEEVPLSAVDVFRAIPSIMNHAYGTSIDALWVNLYMGGDARVEVSGEEMSVHQETTYPWDGYVSLRLGLPRPVKAELRLRVPSWCEDFTVTVNGTAIESVPVDSGYAVLSRKWMDGDVVELVLDMPVRIVDSTVLEKGEDGKRAVQRGPVVYCAEEIDNPEFDTLSLSKDMEFQMEKLPKAKWWGIELMRISAQSSDSNAVTLIPYFAWGNRGDGEMEVFIPYFIK